jgi:hypothetical protein
MVLFGAGPPSVPGLAGAPGAPALVAVAEFAEDCFGTAAFGTVGWPAAGPEVTPVPAVLPAANAAGQMARAIAGRVICFISASFNLIAGSIMRHRETAAGTQGGAGGWDVAQRVWQLGVIG